MLSMVLVVQRRGAASRSSLDHPAGGAEPRETPHTTRGAGLAGEGTVALAFPAARRAMRQPLPVQNEGIYPPHASVRLGMLRLGSVRMRGRKVGRVRSERWARKSAKSVRIKARAGGYPRVGFPPLQPGRKRTRAERHAREGAASRAKRTRRVHAETMLGVRTIWTSRCSRRPSPRSLAQSELRVLCCRVKFPSGPSTAARPASVSRRFRR